MASRPQFQVLAEATIVHPVTTALARGPVTVGTAWERASGTPTAMPAMQIDIQCDPASGAALLVSHGDQGAATAPAITLAAGQVLSVMTRTDASAIWVRAVSGTATYRVLTMRL